MFKIWYYLLLFYLFIFFEIWYYLLIFNIWIDLLFGLLIWYYLILFDIIIYYIMSFYKLLWWFEYSIIINCATGK